MKNDIKIPLLLSLLLHASVFILASHRSRHSAYIILPVELSFSSPAAPAASSGDSQNGTQSQVVTPSKKEEIIVPRKAKKKKAKEEKPKQQARPSEEKQKNQVNRQSAGNGSGQNSMAGAGSGTGGQISLDSANFPYAYYTRTIVKNIGRNWQWSTGYGQMKAIVFFRIQKSGTVSEVNIKETSGDSMFDQQAVRAVKLASPFPPLPDGYSDSDLGVYFEFTYKQ